MKRLKSTFFLFALLALCTLNAKPTSEQYLRDFTSGAFRPQTMAALYSMNDGSSYTMLSEDGTKIIKYDYLSGKAIETIFDVTTAQNCNLKKISDYEFDPQEKRILILTDKTPIYRHSFSTTYYVYNIARNELEPLSQNPGLQNLAQFSPNGRMIAFARGNNLFIKKLDFNTELQITKDGEFNKIINGTADWVYEEEFGCTRYFEWSPDSKLLAWVRFDESEIKQFSFDVYNHPYDNAYTYKYPKAGETNSTVSIHVYDTENRTTKQMDCGSGNDIYFPIIQWTNDNESLAVVRLNRNQTKLDLLSVNPRSGVAKTLLSETDKVYIDYTNYTHLKFNTDNSFVAMSERDGWRHIYHYSANGSLIRQITKGEWDVTAYYGYDEKTKTAYFQAAKEHPAQRHIYKADKKGNIINLDPRPGTHSASFSKGMKYIVSQFHNTTTAHTFTLCDTKGKVLRTIIDNKELQAKFDAYNLPVKEFINFDAVNGTNLYAWIIKPANFDENKEYPLVMVQYSGPNSQEALDRFKPDWEYYLAQEGYIVACVDSRGTGARGHEFRTCTYWNLGKYETEDQVAAAQYFGKLPYINEDRIAIWGWSYGGFMALNCLTYGNETFKAGISIAPVTDWRLYNTAYTERFMSTPQENDHGYEQSDLIEKAHLLKGKLLLCHGTADDNVHFQHAMLYCNALVEAGIQFEMQIYPNKNHSILGAKTRYHLYTRFNNFLKNNL